MNTLKLRKKEGFKRTSSAQRLKIKLHTGLDTDEEEKDKLLYALLIQSDTSVPMRYEDIDSRSD